MSWTREITLMVKQIVWSILRGVHTHLPAKVVSYDGATNTVSIQPCLMSRRADDPDNWQGIELPVIEDVPVQLLGSGKCLLAVAPQAGSYGTYHVSERCLEQWITKGGIVDPGSNRAFDLSDGFFVPGVYPTKTDGNNGKLAVAVETDRIALRTRDNTAIVSVLDDGTIEIETTGNVSIKGAQCVFNSNADSIALASVVDNFISTLDTVIRTAWVVAPMDGGAALKAAYTAAFLVPPSTTASTKVKVDA